MATPIAATTSSAGATGWELNGAPGEELVVPVYAPGAFGLVVVPGSSRGANVSQTSRIDYEELAVGVSAVTSGDVNGDGRDDLVAESIVASEGRRSFAGAVTVVPGRDGRFDSQGAYTVANPGRSAGVRSSLVVDDFDRDGYADAASQSRGADGVHSLNVLWGGPDGLSADRHATLPLPGAFANGSLMRSGNLDRDDKRELVLLRPGRVSSVDDQRATRGRTTVCDMTATALDCADDWRVAPGIASVVVADVVAGGIDDVVLGQPRTVSGYEFETNKSRLWVYRGTRAGVDKTRTKVSLDTAGVPGRDTPYTDFGLALAAADINGDGKDDLAVSARGLAKGGAVVLLYGHRRGLGASTSDRVVSQATRGVIGTAEAGDNFGENVTFLDVDGNDRPDLVVGAPYEDTAWGEDSGAITIIRTDSDGTLRPRLSQQIEPDSVGIPRDDRQLRFGEELPF